MCVYIHMYYTYAYLCDIRRMHGCGRGTRYSQLSWEELDALESPLEVVLAAGLGSWGCGTPAVGNEW